MTRWHAQLVGNLWCGLALVEAADVGKQRDHVSDSTNRASPGRAKLAQQRRTTGDPAAADFLCGFDFAACQSVVRLARVLAYYRANCLSPSTKAVVQIINLIVDFIVAFMTMSHVARPSLAVVADAATNGVGYGTNTQTLLTAVELPTRRPFTY